jgi:hypothetical protein
MVATIANGNFFSLPPDDQANYILTVILTNPSSVETVTLRQNGGYFALFPHLLWTGSMTMAAPDVYHAAAAEPVVQLEDRGVEVHPDDVCRPGTKERPTLVTVYRAMQDRIPPPIEERRPCARSPPLSVGDESSPGEDQRVPASQEPPEEPEQDGPPEDEEEYVPSTQPMPELLEGGGPITETPTLKAAGEGKGKSRKANRDAPPGSSSPTTSRPEDLQEKRRRTRLRHSPPESPPATSPIPQKE